MSVNYPENEIDFQMAAVSLLYVLICHCRRVNDRVIRAAVQAGARSREDVGAACGAGTGCGGCRPAIDRVLADERECGSGVSLPIIRAPEPGT
jgi:bacterioferritin-associated ferredoxin